MAGWESFELSPILDIFFASKFVSQSLSIRFCPLALLACPHFSGTASHKRNEPKNSRNAKMR